MSLLLIISFPLSKLRTPWEEGDWGVGHVSSPRKWNSDGFEGGSDRKIMASLAGCSSQPPGAQGSASLSAELHVAFRPRGLKAKICH